MMKHVNLTDALKSWKYEHGRPQIRMVDFIENGNKKWVIQKRSELSILQMELEGRPDGERPDDCSSWTDYYEIMLEEARDHSLVISSEECVNLRLEDSQYKTRSEAYLFLSCYDEALKDVGHRFKLFDLCNDYAEVYKDRRWLEPLRPELMYMDARIKSRRDHQLGYVDDAIGQLGKGIMSIGSFYEAEPDIKSGNYVSFLKKHIMEIKALPDFPFSRIGLSEKLDKAEIDEDYEEAARLRDMIDSFNQG